MHLVADRAMRTWGAADGGVPTAFSPIAAYASTATTASAHCATASSSTPVLATSARAAVLLRLDGDRRPEEQMRFAQRQVG